jgi:hypothetical protein
MRARSTPKIQKTVRFPKPLIQEVERFIRACGQCESVNDFIVKSMKLRIDVLKRKELDAKFAEMSEDTDYQKEARLIAEEFESSDWEAAKFLEGR